jgi:CRISPR-associated protein Cas1
VAWRGLHISQPAKLRLAQRRLEVAQEAGVHQFPLEDLAWVVLDTPEITTSAALLAACMQNGIMVIVSDDKHLPCGVALPFHQHFRQADVASLQLAASAPLKKRLWQSIVRQKIVNQADALDLSGGEGCATLMEISRRARSGDPDNVEARAARFYWSHLFADFRRQDESDKRNALLNYGYAIVRAALARSLVAYGFLPAFGLHHQSVQNAFNLADDLIEPYRPFIDRLAHARSVDGMGDANEGTLEIEDRRAMAAILSTNVCMADEELSFLSAVDRTVETLQRAFSSGETDALVLPSFTR